jgi:hypothetical protein
MTSPTRKATIMLSTLFLLIALLAAARACAD